MNFRAKRSTCGISLLRWIVYEISIHTQPILLNYICILEVTICAYICMYFKRYRFLKLLDGVNQRFHGHCMYKIRLSFFYIQFSLLLLCNILLHLAHINSFLILNRTFLSIFFDSIPSITLPKQIMSMMNNPKSDFNRFNKILSINRIIMNYAFF